MTIIFGILDTSNPTWTKIDRATVEDATGTGTCVVRKGDFVELKEAHKKEMGKWLTGEHPPYEIDHIAEWRCGRVSLYFKIKGGKDVSVGFYSHMVRSSKKQT